MSAPRVVAVAPGSPAERAGLAPGDEVVRLSGRVPRDVIEWRLLADDADVELDVRRGGLESTVLVSKRAGEPLGAEVHSAVFDRVQTCDNACEFCFIHQLPKGLRPSLYQKDDDFRLSFLYGNFTTLTRFTEADLERVVREGLSPINVSIHATDPEVRSRMLRNRRGATSLRWLRALLDAGVAVHGQVVVCPGVNDGAVLEDTMTGVLDRFPELASLCVVPLGVSRFNRQASMRPHTRAEAEAVVDLVGEWQDRFLRLLGRRLVHAADEYHLLAGRPFPPDEVYEGFPMHEDGVGMARTFEAEMAGRRDEPVGVQAGFFAWVDGAPAEGYRAPRAVRAPIATDSVVIGAQTPVTVLTGEYGARVLEPLLVDVTPARVVPVDNRFFGGNIAVTGLLVGEDVARVLAGEPEDHRYLLPDVCLSGGTFLDGTTPADLPRPVEVVPTDGISLRRALGEVARPVVAIVGRPNVGKSTLLNRIVGRREAIVEERPGVTRDRKVVETEWAGREFDLVDTGGWSGGKGSLDAQVSRQSERAWAEADVVLLVVDVTVGAVAEEARLASILRERDAPVLLVANKVDSEQREHEAWELIRLGLGDPWPVSALHGRRVGDLLDEVVRVLPDPGDAGAGEETATDETDDAVPAVAIVGRPNVGKSTLFNRLLGEDRSVVHDLPGTTRDSVDTVVETDEGPIRFVDTAGLRRKAKIDEGTEYYSLVRALQAIDAADVAVLVIDAGDGVTAQDQRLAERVSASGCPIVVLLNKWETLDAEARAAARVSVADKLAFIGEAPVLAGSALTGKGVHKLVPALGQAVEAYHRRVPTRELNQALQAAQAAHPSPSGRVLYATQGAIDPPTFTLFTNRELPRTYIRYLERTIRERFDMGNTPLKLRVRRRAG